MCAPAIVQVLLQRLATLGPGNEVRQIATIRPCIVDISIL